MLSEDKLYPTVRGRRYRIDTDHWEDLYVVGDVHGCFDAFQRFGRGRVRDGGLR